MVKDTGKTLRADAFSPVNLPEPLRVEEDGEGRPRAVMMPRRQVIADIDDMWRLDDEWWRQEPISRLYYAIQMVSGQHFVIYRDLITKNWYKQAY